MAYTSFFGEKFTWMQLFGFISLVIGNGIFRGIIVIPISCLRPKTEQSEEDDDGLPRPPSLLADGSQSVAPIIKYEALDTHDEDATPSLGRSGSKARPRTDTELTDKSTSPTSQTM